jgi:hypothetical protein
MPRVLPSQVRRILASIPVFVLLTPLSPALAQQKPASPSPHSQAQLEDRVKELEARLNAGEQKAASAATQTKDWIYGVGIALTFTLGVWNLAMAYQNTRRTNFINTVTSQRVKWIEQLRQDISTFCGLTYTWRFSQMEGKAGEHDLLKEVDRLRHVIRLRLNPDGTHDAKIESLIAEIPMLTGPSNQKELKSALDDLTVTTQLLLKEEWDKVKREAEHGNLKTERTGLARP